MRKSVLSLIAILALTFGFSINQAHADGRGKKHYKKYKHYDRERYDDDRYERRSHYDRRYDDRYYYGRRNHRNGPPAWAPAHGYRKKAYKNRNRGYGYQQPRTRVIVIPAPRVPVPPHRW